MEVSCQEFHYGVFPSKLKTIYIHHLFFHLDKVKIGNKQCNFHFFVHVL